MKKLPRTRRFLKVFHCEGIPWPGTAVYNLASRSAIFQRHYEVVAEDILTHRREGSLLDVGTGPAWLLLTLHEKSPRLRLCGLDVSPSMVKKARSNIAGAGLASEIEITQGNAKCLPFPDASFDMVVSTGSIHHWKEPVAGLNELYRVLKSGGHSLLYDVARDTPGSVVRETAQRFGRFGTVLLWLHAFEEPFYSCEEFLSLAEASLFRKGQGRFVGGLYCLSLTRLP
jgi:ubiquinone/menaquinone biosynthesis C-methylase UbiE